MSGNLLFNHAVDRLRPEELAQDLVVIASDLGVSLPKGSGVKRLWGPRHWALRHINFELKHGERIGVLGRNGSGKSTLLRTLAGIISSDEGSMRFAPDLDCVILAPGAGFDNDLTGRENLYTSALFHGHLPEVVRPRVKEIIAFSEIGEWADEPVGIYSAGMRARLGFSLSLFMPSDVLMIDETLSAGDATFREKANEAILSLANSGRTVIVVSHNVDMMRTMCTRGIVLDAGVQIASGEIAEVIAVYQDRTAARAVQPSGAARKDDVATFQYVNINEKVALLRRKREDARRAKREADIRWQNSEHMLVDVTAALIAVQQELIDHLSNTRSDDEWSARLREIESRCNASREAASKAQTERDIQRKAYIRARAEDESLLSSLEQTRRQAPEARKPDSSVIESDELATSRKAAGQQ
jgi:ABC-type polysaccharide/polyol phosphate transport system ATPase subunit